MNRQLFDGRLDEFQIICYCILLILIIPSILMTLIKLVHSDNRIYQQTNKLIRLAFFKNQANHAS